MRILVVTNLYPPHHFGGYEDLCAGAVAAWRAAGHEVAVLTSTWRRADRGEDPAGAQVVRALPIAWDDHRMLTWGPRTGHRMAGRAVTAVREAAAALAPDVASVWNAAALPFAIFPALARLGIPQVLVIGDTWLEWGPRADPWTRRFVGPVGRRVAPLARALTGRPTGPWLGEEVVACFGSEYLRRRTLERTTWRFAASPLVPHGLDTTRFPPVDAPEVRPWEGRLLYVGRLDPRKGVHTAVRALASLPDAVLDVVGTGDAATTAGIESLARELRVEQRVRLHGEADAATLRRHHRRADALVFPSEWQEPFGIAPLEAMSQGLPVLATGTGGSGEFLVDDRTAVRFAPGDADDLARAVTRLATDEPLRARLVRVGPDVARWLSRDTTYRELEAWHAAAAGRGTPPPERSVLPASVAPPVGDEV